MESRGFATNLEYYKVFYYVVKCGTLTAAANRLCLTQPTVTSALQKLEEQLGCTLLLRTRKGVTLTREGELLWNRIEPACQLMLSAEQELESVQQFSGGVLSIAATEMGFMTYVFPVLERFTADHPGVKIRFRNYLTGPVLDKLQSGEVDLAILHTPFQEDKRLLSHPFGSITECFVTGPKYGFLAEQPCRLADLIRYPFVSVLQGSATKRFLQQLFYKEGLVFEPDIEVTTIQLVTQSVLHNFGVAMLPWERVRPYVERGELLRIPVEIPERQLRRQVCVLTHRDIPLRPAAEIFLEQYLKPFPHTGGEV